MTTDLSTSRIYTDFQGLSDLRRAAKQDPGQALEEVATQFEAIFIQMMLKSMRDASLSEGIFDSDQSEMYMDMFDQQISLDLSAKGAFGIADMLVQQLANNKASETISATHGPLPVTGAGASEQRPVTGTETTNRHGTPQKFESPQAFVEFMRPQAERAANKLGVKPQVLIAQAALETGWGQKIIERADGTSSYNLFGIKADRRWSGAQATVRTLEYSDGVVKREQASFRAYESFQQSFDDYVEFIEQGSRYQGALNNAADPRHYIQTLQEAGYASDPGYAEKVIDIMERHVG